MALSVKEKSKVEGDTLYFKEQKELYTDLTDLLRDYSIKFHPETYWKSDDSLQCSENRNRSFDDLLLLSQNHFPATKVEDVVNFYINEAKLAKNQDKIAYCSYCSGVKKPVVHPHTASKRAIMDTNAIKDFFYFPNINEDLKEESEYSPRELINMVK